jgi:hypothetical protein
MLARYRADFSEASIYLKPHFTATIQFQLPIRPSSTNEWRPPSDETIDDPDQDRRTK